MDRSEFQRLPSLSVFEAVWTKRYNMETHLGEPLPSSIKLVLGVLTVAQDAAYRQVIRETWLQQTGVCYWSRAPQKRCSVYAAFVIGKNGSGTPSMNVSEEEMARAHREEGMLVLDTAENMNGGKSLLWFATALKMFPWATHIGKIDMDTYPFLHKLLHRMNLGLPCKGQDSPYEFIGRPRTCRRGCPSTCGDECIGDFSQSCPASHCATQFHSRLDSVALGAGWRFLLGSFYMLSLPLVKKIDWSGRRSGNEDITMSKMVEDTAREQQFCVTIKRPDAWYHAVYTSDPAYANDF